MAHLTQIYTSVLLNLYLSYSVFNLKFSVKDWQ